MKGGVSVKSFSDLFTRDNITLALAILGSVLSVWSLIATALSRRVRLSITVSEYKSFARESACQMYIQIANHSSLPVAITRLQFSLNGNSYDCCSFPEKVRVFTTTSNDIESVERVFYTLPMPISLDALGATCGYVQFSRPKGIFPLAPKDVTLLVSTNRARKLTLSIAIPPDNEDP